VFEVSLGYAEALLSLDCAVVNELGKHVAYELPHPASAAFISTNLMLSPGTSLQLGTMAACGLLHRPLSTALSSPTPSPTRSFLRSSTWVAWCAS
jgi:hypothetical protein